MPLGGLPATPEELSRWMLDYEREHWRYTDDERGSSTDSSRLDWTTRWVPHGTQRLGRQVLLALSA
jgi:hypothetical protein